ncbi:MAG: DEAD/DEAH box helicase, partial [Cyanobacteria bacterium]|nr:DEAD/DEAH box helicase [Cyanobacteriota bacterium]
KPKTALKPLRPKPWEPTDGDRLQFSNDGHIEVHRGGKKLWRVRYFDGDGGQPLEKKAGKVERTQLGLVPGTAAKVKGPNVTSMGKPEPSEGGDRPQASSPTASSVGSSPKSSNIPPGARWITVHPGGADSKGVPILIKPHEDGSASVIGGAGGKLNYLKLDKLRSPDQWKAKAKERKVARAEKERKRLETQTPEAQDAEKQEITKAKEHHQTERHKNALETLDYLKEAGIETGLGDEHIDALKAPPALEADEDEVRQWQAKTREATQKVKQIQRAYEHKLITDHEARAAARLGDESLEGLGNELIQGRDHVATNTDGEDISQIQQLPDGRYLVRTGDDEPDQVYDKWDAAAKRHASNVAEHDSTNGGDPSQDESFYDPSQWVKQPKEEQLPEGFTFNAEAAAKVAQLAAARKEIDKGEKDAFKEIRQGSPFKERGYETYGVGDVSHDALDQLEANAQTLQDAIANDSLLSLVGQVDPAGLRKHVTFGGYAKLGEIASDVLKQNTIDRTLIDTLGHNEGAKLLAYQMKQSLSPTEYERVVAAQTAHHAEFSRKLTEETMEEAEPIMAQLREVHTRMMQLEDEVKSGQASLFGGGEQSGDYTPQQQIELDNLTYQSQQLHAAAQKLLGGAVGQLQASAAMTAALEAQPRSLVFAPKKAVSEAGELVPSQWGDRPSDFDDRPSAFDAYQLDPEDLTVDDGPDGQLVTVNESGLKKILEQSYNPEDREAYEQAIAIKRGDHDEADFTPTGFAYRPKNTFSSVQDEAQKFGTDLDISPGMSDGDLEDAVRQYLGARVANGENPLNVRRDLFAPGTYQALGLDEAASARVRETVDKLDRGMFSGRKVSDAEVRRHYQDLGDREAARQRKSRKTDDAEALNQQSLDRDSAIEAAHRTLAATPMARAAMKPWHEMSTQERRHLREYAVTEIMGEVLEGPGEDEPESTTVEKDEPVMAMGSLFGGPTLTPDQQNAVDALQKQREQLRAQFDGFKISQEALDDGIAELNAKQAKIESGEMDATAVTGGGGGSTQWQRFSKMMGGDAKAYEAVRDKLKGQFLSRFASAYGAIAGKPIMQGTQELAHIDRLAGAMLPEDQRQEWYDYLKSQQQSDIAKVRARSGGKFAVETEDLLAKYQEMKGGGNQLALLSTEQESSGMDASEWQRTTLGKQAEQDLQDALSEVVPNFEQLSSAVNIIPEVRWNGGFVAHQRGLKFLQARKKIGIHFSAGAGKSALMLGAFSHLHGQGAVKKSWVCVPSAIVGQFVGEAATFLEPGKYNYNGNLGFSREERLGSMTDPENHIHVTTRESMAQDLLHLVEKHTGVSSDDFQDTTARTEDDRRELMGKALRAEGIEPSEIMLAVDEAHDIARRKGVAASKRSLALDALAYHSSHYIHATGTPLKNDLSEIHDFLCKVAPDKFKSEDQASFLRKYSQDTEVSQRALQRVLAPYTYAVAVKPEAKGGGELNLQHNKPRIPLTEHQAKGRSQILDDYQTVQTWYKRELKEILGTIRESGEDRLPTRDDFAQAWDDPAVREAVSRLASPETQGSMDEEQKRAAIGGQVMAGAAMKNTAMNRLYHRTPFEHNSKAQHLVDKVAEKVGNGKPSVVFSASSQAAEMLREEMGKRGLTVGYIHGGLSAEQKSAERLRFSPGKGVEPEVDVLLCTDAAQTGLNLQRGKYLAHFDVPLTQKAWDQRSARIYRRGQTEDVEVDTLLCDSPEEEISLARMERKGGSSRVFQGHNAKLGHAEVLDDTGLAGAIAQMRAA